jgi:BON domain
MKRNLWVVLVSLAMLAVGCSRVGDRTDAQVASDVTDKIKADNSVPDKQLTITANSGTVTLSGNVSSDAARGAAASDAGQVAGVKTVINNLQVAPVSAANQVPQQQASNYPPPAPPAREERRPSPRTREKSLRPSSGNNNGDDNSRNSNPSNGNGNDAAQSSAPPAPAPPPVPQKVTVPSGTQLSIRLNDEVDSEKAQVGDIFHGSLSAPITIDDETILPTTADVEGRVVDVKSAGKFAGQSVLTLELTKLIMNGRTYSLQTDQWSKSGTGRGKATAAKVGGGAAVGAILGGILGGGKGAAIGATAGAGAGTGASAMGKGQQIILHPEQVIAFQLQNSLTVTPGVNRPAMNQ